MRHSLYFCEKWFGPKKYAPNVWTEDQARAAHVGQQTYSVLVGSLERPHCVILVMANAVAADFLDEQLRPYLSYQHQVVSPGMVFLSMAVHREFNGEAVAKASRYTFDQRGTLEIRREVLFPTREMEIARSQIDVSSNFTPFPEFGGYELFMRAERQLN